MAQSDAAATKSRKSRPPAEPVVSEASLKRLKALARDRVVIEGVAPLIDGGRFAVKRTENELLTVEADIFSDGHEIIAAALLTAGAGEEDWRETPFSYLANDRWTASVAFGRPGPYRYTIIAWRDTFATWASDTKKKRDAGVDIALELREGATLLEGKQKRTSTISW